jgi:hypothetical protein
VKRLLCLVLSAMAFLPGFPQADEKREEKPRFKGVELYSWKDKGGAWLFVLLDGTNRRKTEAEVKGAKDRLQGVEALKIALGRLAVGEQVFWTHPIAGFVFPPEHTRKAIETAAREAKIKLWIAR